jgi:GT2 family glycosyltransferase
MVTVVIVNYNRSADLMEALRSVKEQSLKGVEILVVDNASTDDSRARLAAEHTDVRLVALEENIGMDGYSVGFEEARGTILFQMDNDSLMPDSDVLAQIVRRFDHGPEELAVVATRVEEYRPGSDDVEDLRGRDLRRGPIDTGGFHAGGVAFKKALLDDVGYYNRDVFLYGSEIFLQMKLLAKGYGIHYFPEILMLHKSSPVARSGRSIYYEVRNRYWFMRRFATTAQRARYLPSMLLHDAIYAIGRARPRELVRALRHGFGELPDSLAQPIVSSNPSFLRKIHEFGSTFGLRSTLRRTAGNIRGGRMEKS